MIAISRGARVIEKHIALEGQKTGLDIQFSIKGRQIKKFKEDMFKAWSLIGTKQFTRSKNELKNIKFQRSIYNLIIEYSAGNNKILLKIDDNLDIEFEINSNTQVILNKFNLFSTR